MRKTNFTARGLWALMALIPLLCFSACGEKENAFSEAENGKLLSPSGREYVYFASELELSYLGEPSFFGSVKGEEKTSEIMGLPVQTGLFSVESGENPDVLIRVHPDSEFFSIYRKGDLSPFDFSVENCARLELKEGGKVSGAISDKGEIADFLSEVRGREVSRETDLTGRAPNPYGSFINVHRIGAVYGCFDEEASLAIAMDLWSYNDEAFSIEIEGTEYALPEVWLERLREG